MELNTFRTPSAAPIRLPIFFLTICLLILSGCGAALKLRTTLTPSPSDIPIYGKVSSRNFSDTSTFTFPLTIAWEYDASAGFGNGSPIVVGDVMIVGTMQGELHAVDILTGKRIKYVKNFSPISSSPAVYKKYVIFGIESSHDNLVSIDTDDGDIQWSRNVGGIVSSPLIKDDLLFVGGLDGTLYCFEAEYGVKRWGVNTESPIYASTCASGDLVYCANSKGDVIAFTIADGKEVWKFSTENAVFAGLTTADGKLFVGSRDSNLYILDAFTGILRNTIAVGNKIMSAPAVNDGIVYVSSLDGTVSAYAVSDATLQWKFHAKSVINTTPIITPRAIFVASLDQYLYAISPQNGTVLWKYNMESRIKTTPLVWKNSVIIAAEDKSIYCFR